VVKEEFLDSKKRLIVLSEKAENEFVSTLRIATILNEFNRQYSIFINNSVEKIIQERNKYDCSVNN